MYLEKKKRYTLIQTAIEDAADAKAAINRYNKQLASCNEFIQEYFDKNNLKSHTIQTDEHLIIATKVEKVTVDYDVKKLRSMVDQDLMSELVDKTYGIEDMNGLIKLLKKYKVPPAEFKKYIKVDEKVNKERIKQSYEIGDIKLEDLKGCYKAKIVKYITIHVEGGTD